MASEAHFSPGAEISDMPTLHLSSIMEKNSTLNPFKIKKNTAHHLSKVVMHLLCISSATNLMSTQKDSHKEEQFARKSHIMGVREI